MGVFGLLSHCMRNKDKCAQYVDLIEVARQQNGIEILVDYYSFQQLLLFKFWSSMCAVHNNDFIRVSGGEYDALDMYLTKLVTDLSTLGIRLVFYIDGAKGSSKTGTQTKFDTWVNRHHRDCASQSDLLEVCAGQKDISTVKEQSFSRPVLMEVQFIETLNKCNSEIVQICAGEADPVIARDLLGRPKAYAILSNDSDFCVLQNCRLVSHELFDVDNDLRLGDAIDVPEKPVRLTCGVISSSDVTRMFGFRSHFLLVELALVAGNDATSSHMRSLKFNLGIRGDFKDLNNVAGWVLHYKQVENHPAIADAMHRNQQLAHAVHSSRQFYGNKQPMETPAEKSKQSAHIIKCVAENKYPPHIFGMHHNFYWHRMLIEDTTRGHPSIELALSELRGFMYRMLLPQKEYFVVEYGRTPDKEFESMQIYTAEQTNFRLCPTHYLQADRVFENLRNFHNIMSHQEPGEMKWFDRYGRRNGFLCYVLRYMLILNTGKNLWLQLDEFLSLIATAFAHTHSTSNESLPLAIRPSTRCVTIGNWFQDVYRHAYYFLGKVLHLTHEFPPPKDVFSGSLWTAFYMMSVQQVYENCVTQPSLELLDRTWYHRQHVIKEKRHMIRYLVKDVFQYDDRW